MQISSGLRAQTRWEFKPEWGILKRGSKRFNWSLSCVDLCVFGSGRLIKVMRCE